MNTKNYSSIFYRINEFQKEKSFIKTEIKLADRQKRNLASKDVEKFREITQYKFFSQHTSKLIAIICL